MLYSGMLFKLLIVGLGGFIGAVARYSLSGLIHRYWTTGFPVGTLIVNVLGCFVIGGFLYYVESRAALPPTLRLFAGIGILGAFTTFSTFGYETAQLIGERQMWYAALNVLGNMVLGLVAVWLGRTLLRAVHL